MKESTVKNNWHLKTLIGEMAQTLCNSLVLHMQIMQIWTNVDKVFVGLFKPLVMMFNGTKVRKSSVFAERYKMRYI